ncbi:MAG: hypothetical protein ABR508_01640 [Candidatus Baltobacteraceae bacterium]
MQMAGPFDEDFTAQNPIVAAATKIRARREIEKAIDGSGSPAAFDDAQSAFAAFGAQLQTGIKRLNAILGERTGVKFIRLLKPERVRLRFREHRIALDLDEMHQLVRISGLDFDGEYQFDPDAAIPSLINLSKVSTEAGYGEAVTPSTLLKRLAQDAQIPPPPHLSGPGPLQF